MGNFFISSHRTSCGTESKALYYDKVLLIRTRYEVKKGEINTECVNVTLMLLLVEKP